MPTILDAKRFAALAVAIATALAMTLTFVQPAEAASRRERKIHNALKLARHQKGDQYNYGSNGPRRFDCSGLVQFVYRRAGFRMPRTSGAQANRVRRIRKRNMRPGDLMFFHSNGDVYHVAIYTGWTRRGKRRLIHAANPRTDVRSTGVWTRRWYAGTLRRR